MNIAQVFIEPVDTLALRGNKLFGAPGSFGESFVPPWPSVAAGALRSALLVRRRHDFGAFKKGEVEDEELGTPTRPGTFAITRFQLARRHGNGAVEPLFGMPADLSIARREHEELSMRRISPLGRLAEIQTSAATQAIAVLAAPEREKPIGGLLLTAGGWRRYLSGQDIEADQVVRSSDLWRAEARIGIALDASRGAAADGALFTSENVVFVKREHSGGGECALASAAGFLAEVTGATLPDSAMLRFGGDGHAAIATRVEVDVPTVDYGAVAQAGRCRLILTTPGLFERGWLPTGVSGADKEDLRFKLHGVEGRLVCAAVPRAETISGFDVAAQRPKPAQRVAPAGSVYWLDDLQGSVADLRNLAARGLWSVPVENPVRRAEGFNRVALGLY